MTKVKICGITNLEDALLSAKFGADALGFNFYPKSPRCISPEEAAGIIAEMPEKILNVGVFVNEDLKQIVEISEIAGLDAIQLHGDETPEFVRELKDKTGLEIIKAFRVGEEFRPEDVLDYETDAILLDAFSKDGFGGTGETFDWDIISKVREFCSTIYLAGGLNPENIQSATLYRNVYAVDVCSGVEQEPRKKDKIKLINFLCKVRFSNQKINDPSQIQDLIFLIKNYRQRPKLYLPEKSITHLCTFIIGYLCALNHTSKEYKEYYDYFQEFDRFLEIRKGMFIHHFYEYSRHFLDESEGNEADAFDMFYAKLEEFELERNTNEQFRTE